MQTLRCGYTGLLLAAAFPALAQGQDKESPWTFKFGSAFVNQYLWRGFVLNDSPSLQPAATIGYKGLSLASWSSFGYRSPTGQNWTEHDLIVDYTHTFDKLSVSGGYIWYSFPAVTENPLRYSHEFYGGVAYNTWLKPSFKYYRDVDQGDGNYFYFSGSHAQPLGKGVVLNGLVGVGLNDGMWISNTTVSNFDMARRYPVGKGRVLAILHQMVGHRIFGHHRCRRQPGIISFSERRWPAIGLRSPQAVGCGCTVLHPRSRALRALVHTVHS
jgi:hypothetical protein